MKKFILLFLPIFLFSFELEFDKKFYHELPHDTLSTDIFITIEDDKEKIVSERLEIFNQKIKSFDKVERKFGSLNIRPKYRHSNSTPKIIAYEGILKYKINSRKANYMNEFVSEITKLKENRDTTISIYDLSWSVREETYNVTLDLLRLEAINWGINYVTNLSKDLSKICSLKNVSINKRGEMIATRVGTQYSNETNVNQTIAVPEANREKIVIVASYEMECKWLFLQEEWRLLNLLNP